MLTFFPRNTLIKSQLTVVDFPDELANKLSRTHVFYVFATNRHPLRFSEWFISLGKLVRIKCNSIQNISQLVLIATFSENFIYGMKKIIIYIYLPESFLSQI